MSFIRSFFQSQHVKDLFESARQGRFDWIEALVPVLQNDDKHAQEHFTHALEIALEQLGTTQRQTLLKVTSHSPHNTARYQRCVNLLIPLSNCADLIAAPKFVRIAETYAAKAGVHYSDFFTAVEAVVKQANTDVPPALDTALKQHRSHQQFEHAAQQGDLVALRALLNTSSPKANNNRALWLAARYGHEQCVRELIAVSDFSYFKEGFPSPLEIASEMGNTSCVALLLQHSHTSTHLPACVRAAENGCVDVVELLLPYILSNETDALWKAAGSGGSVEIVARMEAALHNLQYGLALEKASVEGHTLCVEYLATKASRSEAFDALTQLAQWPARHGANPPVPKSSLEFTDEQKQCIGILAQHCTASDVLSTLQKKHPNDPLFWHDFEEHLCELQRETLMGMVQHDETPHRKSRKI